MRSKGFSSLVFVVFVLAWLLLPASNGLAQTVLNRARLGSNTEDITYVTSGPFADQVAILDGYEVRSATGKLFDLRGLGIQVGPRGITFIESEGQFALNDPTQVTTLFLTDDQGQPSEMRTIRFLPGFVPEHVEGLAYIPTTSPMFPDHLIEVALTANFSQSRLEVMRRDGQVMAEIIPGAPLESEFITGVAFRAPDRILVSTVDATIWIIDFAGRILAGPVTLPGVEDIEGIVQLPDGRIVAAAYDAGKLFFFGEDLNRLPDDDQDYTVGVAVSRSTGVAWNSDTGELLISHQGFQPQVTEVVSVPLSLDSATQVVNLTALGFNIPRGTTYLPDERLIAVAHRGGPRAILLFNADGTLAQQIDVSALGIPLGITYIPSTQQFAVAFSGQPNMVRILSRSGALVRTLDLSSTGIGQVQALTFFNPDDPSGGQFLFFGPSAAHRAIVTDFSGNLVSQFDYRATLGILVSPDVTAITTGDLAGAFAAVDLENSEVVVFSLP